MYIYVKCYRHIFQYLDFFLFIQKVWRKRRIKLRIKVIVYQFSRVLMHVKCQIYCRLMYLDPTFAWYFLLFIYVLLLFSLFLFIFLNFLCHCRMFYLKLLIISCFGIVLNHRSLHNSNSFMNFQSCSFDQIRRSGQSFYFPKPFYGKFK